MAKDGLTSRLTSGGQVVLRCHYTADSHKDPRTPEGRAWLQQAASGYKQGIADPGWRKEYEIQYGALGGTPLFPLWETYKPCVVMPPVPLTLLPHAKLYGTYDHGNIHNAVYLVHAVLPDGRKYTIWEFAAKQVPIRAIADIIKGQDVVLRSDGRHFAGNPYAGREVVRLCDPHLFERRGRIDDHDPYASVGDLFRDKYGVSMQAGKKGGDLMVASWLTGDLWLDPEQPRYQIFDCCRQLLYELPRLRHKQLSPTMARSKADPEDIVDKENDAWDALKYFLRRFPSTVAPKQPSQVVGTFAYLQKLTSQKSRLRNRYSRV
jgi:hypothetical protein